jgi:hypothetical protein
LQHGGTLYQCPDVTVELLLLRVCRLRQVAQEHRQGGDVLAGPRKLRRAVGIRDDGLLDLTGVHLHAAHSVTSIWLGVASGVHRRRRRLVLPPLAGGPRRAPGR